MWSGEKSRMKKSLNVIESLRNYELELLVSFGHAEEVTLNAWMAKRGTQDP